MRTTAICIMYELVCSEWYAIDTWGGGRGKSGRGNVGQVSPVAGRSLPCWLANPVGRE